MLATGAASPPTGAQWAHEVKWDGMRVLAEVHDGAVRLTSRTERDVTVAFPELRGLADTYDDLVLDGEVIALENGRPSFHALSERLHVADPRKARRWAAERPVTYMVFDLLRLFGQDLTAQPWSGRRQLLESLELGGSSWQVPAVYDDGAQLLAATRAQGLEGVVSKLRSSRYLAGARSADWVKVAHRPSVSVVVGGWRPQTGSASVLGAVLVGIPDGDGGFRFAGRVGSGLVGAAGARLLELLTPLARESSPFSNEVPAIDADGTNWVEPRVVIDVASLATTGERLRQPSFQGVRTDLDSDDVREGIGTTDG